MRRLLCLLVGALLLSTLAACGSEDRTALARQTVQSYWQNIGHGKMKQAYYMQSSGVRQTMTLTDWGQNLFEFLKGTEGVRAVIGTPTVSGDQAAVPVTLKSPKAPNPKDDLHAYQHLFWENGTWKVSDQFGTLSHQKGV